VRNALIFLCFVVTVGFGQDQPQPSANIRYPRPQPKYKVSIERRVMIPVRDGVNLSTDLYFPEGAAKKLPVILIRTPYNKRRANQVADAEMWAGQGYIVAVQDTRGKFESEGLHSLTARDAEDGSDTATWLATQPWSTGKIGTFGCSYLGEVQVILATQRNPSIKAMIPQAGPAIGSADGRYRYMEVEGGAYELAGGFGWFREDDSKLYFRAPPGTPRDELLEYGDLFNPGPNLPDIDYAAIWWTLPLVDMMKKAHGPPTEWEGVVSHDLTDNWWEQFEYLKPSDRFNVPALHIDSWYDYGVNGVLFDFNQFRVKAESDLGRSNQFAIISPSTHCASEHATEHTTVGTRDVGDAQLDFYGIYAKWFDYWLKDIDNGVTKMPKLQIYVMGRNRWRAENEWPLARTVFTKYYLHSHGRANSRQGDGALTTTSPTDETPDRFTYDPATPVPTVGGPLCCWDKKGNSPAGAFDQSEVEMRNDILVYTTPALIQGVEVTGPLEAVLYISSSAHDTDFTAKLVDVYPDGTAYNVQEGIMRARYRDGYYKKVWINSNEVYKITVDLNATSNYFGPGHHIRLELSSSNFPRFDRNLNTGGNNYDETKWVIAENSVLHSSKYPSHILLPVIPETEKTSATAERGELNRRIRAE